MSRQTPCKVYQELYSVEFFICYTFSLQLLFFFVWSMLMQNQVYGKPYFASHEAEHSFIEEEHESIQTMQSVTSGVRGKRETPYLKNLCPKPRNLKSSSSIGCANGFYLCYGHREAVCPTQSFYCLSEINRNATCTAKHVFVEIDLGSKGKRIVRRTKSCSCGN